VKRSRTKSTNCHCHLVFCKGAPVIEAMPAMASRRQPPVPPQHLPISEQAVHEVLLSQPGTEMPAAALSALFSPRDDAERLKLTRAISRLCDMRTTPAGEPAVRLRGSSAAHSPPLPIGAMAVRALLLAQPGEQMDVQALRERFAPADEAERQLLVAAISDVGELAASDRPGAGPILRLRREGARTPPSSDAKVVRGGGTSPASVLSPDDAAQPVTSVERELVRKVLGSSPGGLSAAQFAKLISPADAGAKKRLARVVAEVARVTERLDGHGKLVPVLMLRDAPDGEASALTSAAAAEASRCSSMTSGAVPSGGADGQRRGEHMHARVVTEEMVVELLRAKGGRMLSSVLISQLQPLDSTGRRSLAAIVQRVCKTVLPASRDVAAHSGAIVVLREVLLADKVEARAATCLQRRQRERQAHLLAAVGAAIKLQSSARRLAGARAVVRRRIEMHAALVLQAHARRRMAAEHARRRRTALEAATAVQMAFRRLELTRRVAARQAASHAAATAVQAAARGARGRQQARHARREALLARETDEQRAERLERERTALLRQKLLRRRRQQQTAAATTAAAQGEEEGACQPPPLKAPMATATSPLLTPAPKLSCLAARMPQHGDEHEPGGDDGDALEAGDGAADVNVAGEDFLAGMRKMMQQYGAELGASL
jgi:hypothetical protein